MLRYLTDAYRTLRQTVPDAHRSPELEEIIEWLGETVRQTDSSLLDEWEALTDPEHHELHGVGPGAAPPPPRALSQQERPLRVMVRNAMFRRVELVARDDVPALAALERTAAGRVDPPLEVVMDADEWDRALEEYFEEHDRVGTGPDARGPELFTVDPHPAADPAARRRAAPGRSGRPSTTRPATATGSSRPSSTSTPPTTPARPSSSPPPSAASDPPPLAKGRARSREGARAFARRRAVRACRTETSPSRETPSVRPKSRPRSRITPRRAYDVRGTAERPPRWTSRSTARPHRRDTAVPRRTS